MLAQCSQLPRRVGIQGGLNRTGEFRGHIYTRDITVGTGAQGQFASFFRRIEAQGDQACAGPDCAQFEQLGERLRQQDARAADHNGGVGVQLQTVALGSLRNTAKQGHLGYMREYRGDTGHNRRPAFYDKHGSVGRHKVNNEGPVILGRIDRVREMSKSERMN